MTGADIRRAIVAASSLTDPRLSEVEWDDVARELDRQPAPSEGLREAIEQIRKGCLGTHEPYHSGCMPGCHRFDADTIERVFARQPAPSEGPAKEAR